MTPNWGLPDVVSISNDKQSISDDSVDCLDHNTESEGDGWINHPDLLNNLSQNQTFDDMAA